MNMMDAVKAVYGKYFDFSGRAIRPEYWWYFLFSFFVSAVIAIAEGPSTVMIGNNWFTVSYGSGILSNIWSLFNFIPAIAVSVRRLHDLDKSGWWLLIGLVPLIGWIILIVWFASRGTPGANRFGPYPAQVR
jgi:uncharacterized membrane protein YhaH (DUF805 family)